MIIPHKPLLIPLAITCIAGCKEKAEVKRPNIIIMMTDDHTTQAMSCYGSRLMQTPNLDRLAKEGMLFENCYVTNAISGPSRACILTGKFGHKNGFTDNSQTFNGDQQTYPKLLKAAGYQTAMIGKWHLDSDPQGFDFWSVLVGQGEYYSPIFKENGKEIVEPGYVTDIVTNKTIDFLDKRDKSKPFAVMYYHKAPHRNWMPAQRYLGAYDTVTFPEPANLLDNYAGRGRAAKEQLMQIDRDMWPEWDLKLVSPEEMENITAGSQDGETNKEDVSNANDRQAGIAKFKAAYMRMNPEERASWDKAYAARIAEYHSGKLKGDDLTRWKYQQYMKDYCATVRAVDENVGRLLKYLEEQGELDNTIIVYTSDQGFFLGEHGWFDKRFMYEECQRMPLLVRYPQAIKAGSTTKALAMNVDFAPTFLDFAGVEIPRDIQGESLRPILENEGHTPENWREAVYYHYYEYPSWHMVKRHYGIRTDRYKLIHFYNDVDEWELYDLQNDPMEMQSVYDDPAYTEIKADMHKRLKALQEKYEDNDPQEKEHEFFKGYEHVDDVKM